jgi:hypothetical protein
MNVITQKILENVESLPETMQEEALDFVQFLKNKMSKQTLETSDSTEFVNIMNKIAERGSAFKDIDDPSAWQREIRKERPLPGREK